MDPHAKKKSEKMIIPRDRPAFQVDQTLREAAKKASAAFAEEEKLLRKRYAAGTGKQAFTA